MFLDEQPYELSTLVDAETWTVIPIVKTQPPLRLSTIIGDCVTNLRAALDYTMWQLAERYFQPAASVANREDRTITAFPINSGMTKQGYLDRLNRLAQRQVPVPVIDVIKTVQPDQRGYEPLEWLHILVNGDKHRMPLLTIGVIAGLGVVTTFGNMRSVATGKSFRNGVTYKADAAYLALVKSGAVKVEAQAAVDVTWKDAPVPTEPVDMTLEQIVKAVADIIPRFDVFLS
jgi:hypothetical protein